jgi:hypothetical protein
MDTGENKIPIIRSHDFNVVYQKKLSEIPQQRAGNHLVG